MAVNPYFRVVGAWTKAGVASCIRIDGQSKEDNVLLDCGICHSESYSVKNVLISHGHIDHAGSIISHARANSLSSHIVNYYVPKEIIEPLKSAKEAFETMDGRTIMMNLIGVSPGDTFNISPNVKVTVFQTEHRVVSQGYALYSKQKGKLLPEYQSMTATQLKAIRKSGVDITAPGLEKLELVYTGDTKFSALLRPENQFVFQSPILIMELTYLNGDYQKALQWEHVHIQDIISNHHLFSNENIIFVHLSQKYSLNQAIELLYRQLPPSIVERVLVSLHSFGDSQFLTSVVNSQWQNARNHVAGWGWSSNSNFYQHRQGSAQVENRRPSSSTPNKRTNYKGNHSSRRKSDGSFKYDS